MHRSRYSWIAHRDHVFCNPINDANIDRAIELLNLPAGARVIDFGAGKCELLIRLVERYGIRATGVELSPLFAEEARRRAKGRIADDALVIREQDAGAFIAENAGARFDAAICVGSTHAFGDYERTLDVLTECVEPGGKILVGEGYWKQPPCQEYLAALGAKASDLTGHDDNVRRATQRGLTALWAVVSSMDDWDEYEGKYARGIETYVAEHPDDPEAGRMLQRSRAWRETVLRWGRDTLGFGLYRFAKADPNL